MKSKKVKIVVATALCILLAWVFSGTAQTVDAGVLWPCDEPFPQPNCNDAFPVKPVGLKFALPDRGLEELFNRQPDRIGSAGRKLFGDLILGATVCEGGECHDMPIEITNKLHPIGARVGGASGIASESLEVEFRVNDRVVKTCRGGMKNIVSSESSLGICEGELGNYRFRPSVDGWFHTVEVVARIMDSDGNVKMECGSAANEMCEVKNRAKLQVLETSVNEFSLDQNCSPGVRSEGRSIQCTAMVRDLRPSSASINAVSTIHRISSEEMDIHACSFEVESVLINTEFTNPIVSPSVCTAAKNVDDFAGTKIKEIECTLESQDEPIFDDAVITLGITCDKPGFVKMRLAGTATPGPSTVVPGNPDSELPFMDAVSFEFVPLVNEFVALNSVNGKFYPSGYVGAPPFPSGVVGVFSISAVFTNNSGSNICNGGFEIVELHTMSSTQLEVFNARGDGPFGGVGEIVPYRLVSSVKNMSNFEKGERVQFDFNIFVPTIEGIRFYVNMVGYPTNGDCPP